MTNYSWFSEGWLIGLGILGGGIAVGILLTYFKIKG